MAKSAFENDFGCGLIGGIFHRRSFSTKKTSVKSLHSSIHTNNKASNTNKAHKQQQIGFDKTFLQQDLSKLSKPPPSRPTPITTHHHKNHIGITRPLEASRKSAASEPSKKPNSDPSRSSTSSSSNSTKVAQTRDLADLALIRKDQLMISGSTNKKNIVSAATTSGNVMHIGLGHQGHSKRAENSDSISNPNTLSKKSFTINNRNGSTGNILRQCNFQGESATKSTSSAEFFKNLGNEEYKKGKFQEALDLYNQAIRIDSEIAIYHCNKAAALTCLGRLVEAALECHEALKIEPYYHKAHLRLATLYLRLGVTEKALYHYNYSSPKVDSNPDSDYTIQVRDVQAHLNKASAARKLHDWNTLLKEARLAISSGADASPQVYALQADALLKLHRHQEANDAFHERPNFDMNASVEVFGAENCAYFLVVQAQLLLATGRLEEGVASAQKVALLDPNNKEVASVIRRIKAVVSARMRGNQLFNSSRYSEACCAYNEGLEHDPYNSVLLCNRAACRSKLGQFEKAIEDCDEALKIQPAYSKARLRKANCNAKLERWEASIQDYEMLIRETPGDEEVGRALFEAQIQIKKLNGVDTSEMKFGSNLVVVNSNERFKHFTTSPGMSVVLFCCKRSNKQVLQRMDSVCKRFPSVNFLKVEVEDHPYLAKTEEVSATPVFKIYKNGSRVKDISGNNVDLLEKAIQVCISSRSE